MAVIKGKGLFDRAGNFNSILVSDSLNTANSSTSRVFDNLRLDIGDK